MALIVTSFAAILCFLIGFVTARLMRLGGFVVVIVALLIIAAVGRGVGLEWVPGVFQIILMLVVLQGGFLGGAVFFARRTSGLQQTAEDSGNTKSVRSLKSDPHG